MTASTREVLDAIRIRRIPEADTELFATFRPWKKTDAEIAAGVTPVNYAYAPGHAFRFMTSAQAASVVARDLTQDVTAALNTLFSVPGIAAYLPAGTYQVTSNLAAPACSEIYGDGFNVSILQSSGCTLVLSLTNNQVNYYVHDICVKGDSTASAIGIAIGEGSLTSNGSLENFQISGFSGTGAIGLDVRDAVAWQIFNPLILLNTYGVRLDTNAIAGTPTTTYFFGGSIEQNSKKGVNLLQGYAIVFYGVVIQTNGEEGVFCSPVSGAQVDAVSFLGCWFEANYGADPTKFQVSLDSSTSSNILHVAFDFCYFNGTVGTANSIRAVGTFTGIVIGQGNIFPNIGGSQPGVITISSGAFGMIALNPALLANYSLIVTDANNTATNQLDEFLPWTAWTPTFSSSVGNAATTFSGAVTVTLARYKKVGKTAHVTLNFSATLNAVAPNYINLTLPSVILPQSDNIFTACAETNGATAETGLIQARSSSQSLRITRPAGANWGAGNTVSAICCVTFECQ